MNRRERIITAFVAIVAVVQAACPNSCSLHGSCGLNGELPLFINRLEEASVDMARPFKLNDRHIS